MTEWIRCWCLPNDHIIFVDYVSQGAVFIGKAVAYDDTGSAFKSVDKSNAYSVCMCSLIIRKHTAPYSQMKNTGKRPNQKENFYCCSLFNVGWNLIICNYGKNFHQHQLCGGEKTTPSDKVWQCSSHEGFQQPAPRSRGPLLFSFLCVVLYLPSCFCLPRLSFACVCPTGSCPNWPGPPDLPEPSCPPPFLLFLFHNIQ